MGWWEEGCVAESTCAEPQGEQQKAFGTVLPKCLGDISPDEGGGRQAWAAPLAMGADD